MIGQAGEFASKSHPVLAEWRKAVDSTRAVQKLEDLRAAGSIPLEFPDGSVRQVYAGRKASYLLEVPELFSRSYAQFIADISGDIVLGRQIHWFREPENQASVVPNYWDDDDFMDVSTAFKRLIIELRWK